MRSSTLAIALLCAQIAGSSVAFGGVFWGTVECPRTSACAPLQTFSGAPGETVNAQGITYPPTYISGGQASPNVRVCVVDAFDGNLAKAAAWAAQKWNALLPGVNNCLNCTTMETAPLTAGTVSLASTVLHELGHCALGLTHTTLTIDTDEDADNCTTNPPPAGQFCREITSYTVSYGGSSNFGGLQPGADLVKGSRDDQQSAIGGGVASVVHWFRRADNDPIVIDLTPIDSTTYSRAFGQLPASSNYPANANIGVGTLLGYPHTTSVMARAFRFNSALFDLSADDVNTYLMSKTGENRIIGPVGFMFDDHNIQIDIVPCEDPHDLAITTVESFPNGSTGACFTQVDYLYPTDPNATAQDFKLRNPVIQIPLTLPIDGHWEFNIPIAYGSFDHGLVDADWSVFP
ncbi:MAG: hypothetical protein ABI639_09180 [Thermoanaerobaculia bacterium]